LPEETAPRGGGVTFEVFYGCGKALLVRRKRTHLRWFDLKI
jgi:hypothetical protein